MAKDKDLHATANPAISKPIPQDSGNPARTRPKRPNTKRPPLPALLVRVPEAAGMARMSTSKFYELINRGVIPSICIDGMLRIPVAALERFVNEAMQEGERKRA